MIYKIYSFVVLVFVLSSFHSFDFEDTPSHAFNIYEKNRDSTVIYLRFPDLHRNYLKVIGNDSIYYFRPIP